MGFSALAGRIPEWGRLFDEAGYQVFHDAVRDELTARGQPFELHDAHARLGDWELPLLPLAQRCAAANRSDWRALVREDLEARFAEEKLGRELDTLRGAVQRALPALKLRIQRSGSLRPGAVSAPVAGDLHAVLVLDLPSFVTPVRLADLAGWDRPARELVAVALENVKTKERVEIKQMEVAGARLFAVTGASVFVATLGLSVDDLLGTATSRG